MVHYIKQNTILSNSSLPSEQLPHRHFFCRLCSISLNICICCDRNQIYCKNCQTISADARIKSAQKKYKLSRNGRMKKRGQNKRHYKRRINKNKKGFQGDRGSPLENNPVLDLPPVSIPTASPTLAEGFYVEPNISYKDDKEQLLEPNKFKVHFSICSFCDKKCSPFRRSSAPWRQEKKMWAKKIFYLNGGSG
jgi:hypothetical protein